MGWKRAALLWASTVACCLFLPCFAAATNRTNDTMQWSEAPTGPFVSCHNEPWPYFMCVNTRNCFTIQQMCDGHDDCGDSSDELMCARFLCGENYTAMDKFCDGKVDCPNGEDETASSSNSSFVCANAWLSVWDSPESKPWKEMRPPYNPQARTNYRQKDFGRKCALPEAFLCDGINHCGDHSDECNDMCGDDKKFLCDNGRCISSTNVCDWRDDCGDGSDETTNDCNKYYPCDDNTKIAFNKFCDGVEDCPDGSDERKVATGGDRESVKCSNRHNLFDNRCYLPSKYNCDGTEECLGREDECTQNCSLSFLCNDGTCILFDKKCDGRADCKGMEDECGDGNCKKTFKCNDGSCLSLDRFCDGEKHCPNGEDEIDKVEEGYHYCANRFAWIRNRNPETYSNRTCRLPERYMCDGITHCNNRSDECQHNCSHSMFCDGGDTCLPRSGLCDGEATCHDFKDEPGQNVDSIDKVKGFKCAVVRVGRHHKQQCVLPQEMVGDQSLECSDKSDVCQKEGSCATCRTDSNFRIRKSQLCDGVFDCPDLSDECFCYDVQASATCRSSCFATQTPQCPCEVGQLPCTLQVDSHNTTTDHQCIPLSAFCDGVEDCHNRADELYCNRAQPCGDTCPKKPGNQTVTCRKHYPGNPHSPKTAKLCDGRPECADMEDECDYCADPPKYCEYRSWDGFFHCSGGTLPGLMVCDGIAHCPNNNDEKYCEGRWFCTGGGKYSVQSTERCDYIEDCQEGEDEEGCLDTHFYCENESPRFVQRRRMYDGKDDCTDGSDECPPDFDQSSVFSSRYYLIKNHFLKGMVWIMGLLAIGGNVSVMVHTTRALINSKRRKMTKVAVIYNCLVLNLSLADFLMGVFLIALAIKDAASTSKYCRQDHAWRSGSTCASLGVLAVLSSEVSLITLAILSTYRAYCVVRPLQSRALNICTTALFIVLTWFFALFLAFLPFTSMLQDYFISNVWVTPNLFFSTDIINKTEFSEFALMLNNYDNLTSVVTPKCRPDGFNPVPWSCAPKILETFDPEYSVLGYYGYYSTHATCLPKIFATREDVAWEFSIALTSLNFLLCLYIVLVYCVICRPRQINKSAFSSQGTRNMQKKIAILVASDCACWLPICTIAFLWYARVPISSIVYAITAIILLPINSALNPLFYSNAVHNLFGEFANMARKINPRGRYGFGEGRCFEGGKGRERLDNGGHLLRENVELHAVSRSESRLVTEHTYVENGMNESVI